MENKQFKIFDFNANTIDEQERTVIIMASSSQKNRNDMKVQPSAYQLDKIQSLPILFGHNPDAPIGKALWAKITDQGLLMKIKISNSTSVARDVWNLMLEGIVSFFSVGFMLEDYNIEEDGTVNITKADLFEVSATPTPVDSHAIMLSLDNVQSEEVKKVLMDIKLKKDLKMENEKIIELETKNVELLSKIQELELKTGKLENKILELSVVKAPELPEETVEIPETNDNEKNYEMYLSLIAKLEALDSKI